MKEALSAHPSPRQPPATIPDDQIARGRSSYTPREVNSQHSSMERFIQRLRQAHPENAALPDFRAPTPTPHGDVDMSGKPGMRRERSFNGSDPPTQRRQKCGRTTLPAGDGKEKWHRPGFCL